MIEHGYNARYVPSGLGSPKRGEREGGHIAYILNGNPMAVELRVGGNYYYEFRRAKPAAKGPKL